MGSAKQIIALAVISISFVGIIDSEGDPTGKKIRTSDVSLFLSLFDNTSIPTKRGTIDFIAANWKLGYEPMVLETVYLLQDPMISFELITLLHKKSGQNFGYSFNEWYEWLWNQQESRLPEYSDFKANLYQRIDPKFNGYFYGRNNQTNIRLDEVRWGGVVQDGIPPLREPKMITVEEADYLDDDNIVFGIEVNGDVRAYPKRILAWHEMFVDQIDDTPMVGVYCTLCGTVILYKSEVDGINYELGTSGFLYRSNKLMYDKKTQSLWNTLEGKPVVGPLIDKNIELESLSVVTTTWGEWKKRHPQTTVLSNNTGFNRNYGEGVAYADYFSSDALMFNTPYNDTRLDNKAEILAIRIPGYDKEPLAISTNFLQSNIIYSDKVAGQSFVVFTDDSGANRVYESKEHKFTNYDQKSNIIDSKGNHWILEESRLKSDKGIILKRLPYHRAFWFGWVAAFPTTRLVK